MVILRGRCAIWLKKCRNNVEEQLNQILNLIFSKIIIYLDLASVSILHRIVHRVRSSEQVHIHPSLVDRQK